MARYLSLDIPLCQTPHFHHHKTAQNGTTPSKCLLSLSSLSMSPNIKVHTFLPAIMISYTLIYIY